MEFKPNLEEVVQRYEAFWKLEDADRVLMLISIPVKGLKEGLLSDKLSLIEPEYWNAQEFIDP